MKGLFIPYITAEMFGNECLEGIETLMAEGEIYDIDYTGWIPVSDKLPADDLESCKEQKSKLDCISRQDAIDAVNSLTYPSSLMDVKRKLIELPSADRPHGEWIYHMTEGVVETISCGRCSAWYDVTIPEQMATFNYCPNCGADMRGEQDGRFNQQAGGD